MCFQASFATTFARPDSGGLASAMAGYDLLLGAPPQVLARRVTHRVLAALDADTWPQIFRCLAVACPPKDRLAAVLRDAVVRSARYGYHTPGMDFSRIQRSGTSAILRKGESYGIKGEVRHLTLFLGSDSHSILCGACLLYRRGVFHEVVCYNHTRSGDGAVHHSGDSSDEQGNAYHRVEINLARLHDDIDTIYLTVCSCGPANLSGFRNPSIHLTDSNAPNTNLCSYSIDERTRAPSAVMAALRKRGDGAWEMEALGLDCMHRCCSNYKVIRATISQFEK